MSRHSGKKNVTNGTFIDEFWRAEGGTQESGVAGVTESLGVSPVGLHGAGVGYQARETQEQSTGWNAVKI